MRPMAKQKKTPKATRQLLETQAALRGRQREEFFANGGTATQWSLLAGAGTHPDRRREADRTACRGRVTPDE